mgnify:CR=1 FL=1
MCGIVGVVHYDGRPVDVATIEGMIDAISHRGPDDRGVYVQSNVGLGHSRLSIIDVQSGHQPMTSHDKMLSITFNGEIYNYRQLRLELEVDGIHFKTNSDTEVILAAYQRYGSKCLDKLRGMFAFCIADFRSHTLFLARDHAGIKPLFYWADKNFFAFASELSALRQLNTIPTGSLQSIDYFLRYQYIPAPYTIYKEINKLHPAHFIRTGFEGNCEPTQCYWQLHFSEQETTAPSDEEIFHGIEQAVSSALVSDVPVGVFLSGGLDSTCVASLARQQAKTPLQAFCLGFNENKFNEIGHAINASSILNIPCQTKIIDDESLNILHTLLPHYGEPFGDSSAIPTWYVSKLARDKVKVVLSGDGGDELFGGYDRYFNWLDLEARLKLQKKLIQEDKEAGRYRTAEALRDGLGDGPESWSRYVCLTRYANRKKLWKNEYSHLADTPCQLFLEAWKRVKHIKGTMAHAQSMDFSTYLPGAVLTKVDVASMATGLEVRPVFLDRNLMEMAARIPLRQKYGGGKVGKLPLQKLLHGQFQKTFIQRRKQGFSLPAQKWTAPGGAGHKMLLDLYVYGSSPLCEWMHRSEIIRHIELQKKGIPNAHHLWLLLVLGLWINQNLEIKFY